MKSRGRGNEETTGMTWTLAATALLAGLAGAAFARTDVTFYSDTIVRVVKTPGDAAAPAKPYEIVTMKPDGKRRGPETADGFRVWRSPALTVREDVATGCVTFESPKGETLLAEQGAATFTPVRKADTRSAQSFALAAGEPLYGLGLLQNGRLSQRGVSQWLLPENLDDGIPFVQSPRGWGIYWDAVSAVRFDDLGDAVRFTSDSAKAVDYYFILGGGFDGVVAGMRRLTGSAPMLPRWSYGFWQSRERYHTRDEVTAVVRAYRALGIPLDGIIQDWQYWDVGEGDWNGMLWSPKTFPEPKRWIDGIHAANVHIIASVWATFGPRTEPYRDMDEIGALLRGYTTWPPDSPAYDAYMPAARDLYWKHLAHLQEAGLDGWWMDSSEPEPINFTGADIDKEVSAIDIPTSIGPFRDVRLAYCHATVGGVHEHQRAARPDRRVFILTRCGFAGQQRFGATVWSGDTKSNWEALRAQIPALVNMSASGIPQVNCDLGGFHSWDLLKDHRDTTPEFNELYVRWMQFGAFLPMMRSHGTTNPRELHYVSSPGEPVYEALLKSIRLRYRLLPYIYSLSHEVALSDFSFLRPVSADFAADRATWTDSGKFLLGRAFLVAPVTSPGVTEAKVRLPAGADWWDFRDGRRYAGGTEPVVAAPFDSMPVFVRAGSIVPFGPDVKWSDEKSLRTLEVGVYPGADGSYSFFEDAGDGWGYEKGEFSEIPFSWNDAARTLTIGARKGTFPGMELTRVFIVKTADGVIRTVPYDGKETKVVFAPAAD